MHNKPLTRSLSAEAMLELWRLVRHFEPLRADATVTRTDGLDLDQLLQRDLDRWYADCYSRLPDWQLPQQEFVNEVELWRSPDNVGIVRLPECCVKPLHIMVEGWNHPATITTPGTPLAADQGSRYTRGGCVDPVAVVHPAGEVRLYSLPAGADLDSFIGVAMPPDGHYLITDYMLPQIFQD